MVTVIVLKPFYDLAAHVDRKEGEEFKAKPERAKRIANALPDYVSIAEEAIDYTKLSMQELTALAKERGVMPKGRTSKAMLIEILSKE